MIMSADFSHEPVMREEALSWLVVNKTGTYVDGTIGGAGHASAILEQTEAKLIGIDCDADALTAARERLAPFGSRVILVKANFADLRQVLEELHIEKVDGVLLDLGVSSHQLDAAHRGFSFSKVAPLDMRMDQDLKLRAYDIVNHFAPTELEKIIRLYGEERMAARITRAILRKRQTSPIETTVELAGLVAQVMPQGMKHQKIHPATRTFQALRIAVNQELDSIVPGIEGAIGALSAGGRIGVISFHSLEDRIVKNTFRDLAATCVCPKDIPYCVCHKQASVKVLTRKAVVPSVLECRQNPRARSAKLRIAERI
ncbi:MAG: 16S rRNA (cytosine(1402)-N(4))-methyltransferase [Deltaproteobacteria bacterium HGW-Deltaproteobacteria-6]|jgi:16S rRNA (cytosine1402-N4)-methyltransferase|nr:MAG: 16S rRNA (cytosine(1402)-N(4))-methyltransferase [Deltaproteobacteria bacterium HGW-Deltaproteobacteria-6]